MKTQNPAAVVYRPIGVIRSGHIEASRTPIQPEYAAGCPGRAEIFPEFADGLRDLEGFSHVFLLYHFHRAGETRLTVKPFLQDIERGVFATRAPSRPNPIGLSLVTLTGREGNILFLDGLDILDGTPLLDIKPYVSRFDRTVSTRNGWQEEVNQETAEKLGRRMSPLPDE
ncbi:MAG: tRNA (N6-threonylcarbamoyladenosine(37)-N6)-methyltransferase TrmO [Candidatus Aminicenantes bacterium]|nr:tRNA (N6-threonylcarbamoyladenosine(37)-N6)-methyltransferase TrmO [Candidatus Aminicenantes bacterium]